MINRFTLAALAVAFALTGCAEHSIDEPAAAKPLDFSTGATLVTVTHAPAPTADGGPIFVTVDGNEAGALATGESVVLHMPAGKHQVGGYARSLIGHVTVPPVQITTKTTSAKHVAYTVIKSKPTFTELKDDPLPQAAQTTVTAPAPAAAPESTPAAATPAASSATVTPEATPAAATPAASSATVTPEATPAAATPAASSATATPEATPAAATPAASSAAATPATPQQ
ncbi:hypothetical protein [Acerihabitans sp.]|uniref:hypothetical protein n=1 Tax=Acerihabitans sp. TaxID=2811394 RepID=UPI002EDA94F0